MDLGPQPASESGAWPPARRQPRRPHVANLSERDLRTAIDELTERYRSQPFDRRPDDRSILDELLRRLTGRLERWARDFERNPPAREELSQLRDFQGDLQETYDYLGLFHQRRCLYSIIDPEEWTHVLRSQIRDALDTYHRPAAVACKSFVRDLDRGQPADEDVIRFVALVTSFARKLREIVDHL